MKCSACGHLFEPGDHDSKANSSCPRCGAASSAPAPDTANYTIPFVATAKQEAVEREVALSAHTITHPHPKKADETLPTQFHAKDKVYPYLAPTTAVGELGWLAHYRVLKVLGEGGMGTVFEAVDTKLQRSVALKVMKPDVARNEDSRQRFLREARTTAAVKSDHIVTIHQVDQVGDVAFLAMEFLQGESLEQCLVRNRRPALSYILRLGTEVSRGLAAAHQRGLIHRDIKPSNIWLEAPTGRVKILDFGLAHDDNDKKVLTHAGIVLGTPAYMSPEQAEGLAVDARGDLFSLGCVLYELAAGERPFVGASTMAVLLAVTNKTPKPLAQLNPELPDALIDLIMHLLEKKPANRPDSAADVAAALEAIAGDQGIALGATSSNSSLSRARSGTSLRKARRTWKPIPVLTAILALIGAGLLSWNFFHHDNPANRATAPGVTANEIRVGMTGPFSGPASELGSQMELGIKTYFSMINDHGGVVGRKLKLIALDDGYDPVRALANMKELRENHQVFAYLGNVGTPTAAKTIPYALEHKMPFLCAFTGANLLRKNPPDRYVFNYRASYEEETAAIVAYLVNIRKIRPEQIAVFAQNDSYGEDGFHGVVKTLRRHGRDPKDIVKVGYERNTVQVADAVREIAKHPEVRAIVMVATYKPAAEFIRGVKDVRRDLLFTNVSFAGGDSLAEQLKEAGPDYADGAIVTQVVPAIDSSATIVLKYREALKTYFPQASPSFVSMEGYIGAAVIAEGLKRAGENLTSDTLVETLETIRQFDMGIGAVVTFGPSDHQASNKVWGSVLDKSARYQVLDLED